MMAHARRDHPEMKRVYIEAQLFEPSELARE